MTQIAVGAGSRQGHGCGLVEQTSQMGVAAPGDVTAVVDFAGLVTAGRQAQPSPGRT